MTETMSKRKQGRRSNGCGNVRLKGNTYYCRYTDARGVRREVPAHTSNYQEALKVLATYTEPIRKAESDEEIKLRLRQQIEVLELRKDVAKIERLRLDELTEKFLNHRNLTDATSGTKNCYKAHLSNLVNAIKAKYPDVVNVDDVTIEVADGAMNELTKTYTATAYNLALATYRRAWKMFGKTNPFLKIEKRKVDKSRHRMNVTEDDIRRIFKACRDDVERAVWGVGVYTGLRLGDVCSLNYGALAKGLQSITWTPQKTKRHMQNPLTIPVCPALRALLTKVLDWSKIGNDNERDTPLWADYKKRYHGDISEWFGRTLKKAGLQTSHKGDDGHKQVDTGFHITRHFFISNAARYMSPLLVQKIVGHSSIDMTAHYYHDNQADMEAGLSQMPDFNAEKPKSGCKDEIGEIVKTLNELRVEGESALECLRRLASLAKPYCVAG